MPVEAMLSFLALSPTDRFLQQVVNEALAPSGIIISSTDAHELAEHRAAILDEFERVEFGTPAVISIARALASSSCLEGEDVAATLALLQQAFYRTRDELPIDIPDDEIIEAITTSFAETGAARDVAAMPTDELMNYSENYRQVLIAEREKPYRLVDEQGRAYVFDPEEWDYDETAAGWDGEEWADDHDE